MVQKQQSQSVLVGVRVPEDTLCLQLSSLQTQSHLDLFLLLSSKSESTGPAQHFTHTVPQRFDVHS